MKVKPSKLCRIASSLKQQRRHSRNPPSSSTKAEMSESSTDSTRSNRYCFCGMKIKWHTSWTNLNPERRFEHNSQTRHHFFDWLDNETCPSGKEVLPGLLRRLSGMGEEIRARDEQLRLVEAEKKKLEEKVGKPIP
ncbi:reduced lateral root formation [Prunus dulcis]|uniref:Reduced lateral root formation n=1 Tax=Prunus dulcis TaxID=3755 RepID=A0A5H2Y685_PRUDU|nr:reduced lateral root formation [Prunus dulcis]